MNFVLYDEFFSVHGSFSFTPELTCNKVFLQVFGLGVDYMRLAFIEKPIMKLMTLYIDSSQSWMEKKVPF